MPPAFLLLLLEADECLALWLDYQNGVDHRSAVALGLPALADLTARDAPLYKPAESRIKERLREYCTILLGKCSLAALLQEACQLRVRHRDCLRLQRHKMQRLR